MFRNSPPPELCRDVPTLKLRLANGFKQALADGEIKDATAVDMVLAELESITDFSTLKAWFDARDIPHLLASLQANTALIDFDFRIALERCKCFRSENR